MSYATAIMDWSRRHTLNDYTPNQQETDRKRRCRIHKNQGLEIGEQFRCAICGKTMIKQTKEQCTCGKYKCIAKYRHLTSLEYENYLRRKESYHL